MVIVLLIQFHSQCHCIFNAIDPSVFVFHLHWPLNFLQILTYPTFLPPKIFDILNIVSPKSFDLLKFLTPKPLCPANYDPLEFGHMKILTPEYSDT